MRTFLKYIVPILVLAVFLGGEDNSATVTSDDYLADLQEASTTYFTDVSETESTLWLPRQVSSSTPQRVQNNTKRTTTSLRSSLEFAKDGKVINAGIRFIVQHTLIQFYGSHAEPGLRLHRLGRLII